MSANHIPHLLTRLLTESEVEAYRTELLNRAGRATGDACMAWLDAAVLLDKHVQASLARRTKQTPSARRKSLGYRPAPVAAVCDRR